MARRKLEKRAFGQIDRGPLGGAVFEARKRLKLSQAQLAEAIGRDRPWLSDVETGKVTHVPDHDLAELARSLQVEHDDLMIARDRVDSKFQPSAAAAPLRNAMTKPCPSCGNRCELDARFCAHCGKPLPSDVQCPKCARHSPAYAHYCARCGTPLH